MRPVERHDVEQFGRGGGPDVGDHLLPLEVDREQATVFAADEQVALVGVECDADDVALDVEPELLIAGHRIEHEDSAVSAEAGRHIDVCTPTGESARRLRSHRDEFVVGTQHGPRLDQALDRRTERLVGRGVEQLDVAEWFTIESPPAITVVVAGLRRQHEPVRCEGAAGEGIHGDIEVDFAFPFTIEWPEPVVGLVLGVRNTTIDRLIADPAHGVSGRGSDHGSRIIDQTATHSSVGLVGSDRRAAPA